MRKLAIPDLRGNQSERFMMVRERRNLPETAFDFYIVSDEKTGRRFGNAICRRGYADKLGYTTFISQTWSVVKPEFRNK